jgi:hypothetical protein
MTLKNPVSLFLMFYLLLLSHGLFAYESLEFSVEGLRWLYGIDQPNYAIVSNTTVLPNGPRKALKQNWHNGYRVNGALYLPNKIDRLRASWTEFDFSVASATSGAVVMPILIQPSLDIPLTTAKIRNEFHLHYLDVLYGRSIYNWRSLQLVLEAGLQYLDLKMKEQALYSADLAVVNNTSKLEGIGPEISFNFNACLFNRLSLVGSARGAFVVGKMKSTASQSIEIFLARFTSENDPYWIATPTLSARIGLKYTLPFRLRFLKPTTLFVEGGYELFNVRKGINRIYFVDGGGTSISEAHSLNEYMDFLLHGPYFQAGFRF